MKDLIPAFLKAPVPFSEILDRKIPLPAFLETSISLSETAERARRYLERQTRRNRTSRKRAPQAHPTAFSLQGEISRGTDTQYAIDGKDFFVSPDAWIFGDVRLGTRARIAGVIQIDGVYSATKITII